jgi:hypothetical protein
MQDDRREGGSIGYCVIVVGTMCTKEAEKEMEDLHTAAGYQAK